ncbi:MAG: SHOCT domain-containing protein [bacterium]|nr:MAG: SHOCT domain-containing protein [bacterium]
MTIFTWLILIVVAIWFVKYAMDHNIFHINKLDNKNRAFEMLKKRYARGEINKQEYENEKRDLI